MLKDCPACEILSRYAATGLFMIDIECIFCHSIIPSDNLLAHADGVPPENNVSGFESVVDQVSDHASSSKTPQVSFSNIPSVDLP